MDVPAPSTNAPAAPKQPPSLLRLSWPPSAQLAVAFLLGSLLTLIAVHAYSRTRWATHPAELERGLGVAYRIDLNRASRVELLQLPGIGENLARRIEDYRTENGPFRGVNDLIEVRGIGPATLERLRPWVQVKLEDDESMRDDKERPRQPADVKKQHVLGKGSAGTQKTGQKEANLTSPIDLNRASVTELQRLPGIGPK